MFALPFQYDQSEELLFFEIYFDNVYEDA